MRTIFREERLNSPICSQSQKSCWMRPTFATPFARVTLDAVNKAKAVLPDVSDCPYLHRDISRGVHSIKQCPLYPLRTQVGWLPLTTTDRVM